MSIMLVTQEDGRDGTEQDRFFIVVLSTTGLGPPKRFELAGDCLV